MGNSKIQQSIQEIQNQGFSTQYGVPVVASLKEDGSGLLQYGVADSVAIKVTTDGPITYVAIAAPGTSQDTAKWQVKKIDTTSGTVVTWADGDSNFDNLATDLTALTYS